MRILHAIHDFMPRHQAGSEIYAFELGRELASAAAGHHVTVLCAEYDPSRRHGHVAWRVHAGLPVVEIVNNWMCRSFEETYRPPLVTGRIEQVLRAVQPDIVHIHNLTNLSFALPALAHAQGAAVVATLHDYSLVCPSGGQRIHRAGEHLCEVIDTDRCARCFGESPFAAQISFGKLASLSGAPGAVHRAASATLRRFPRMADRVARTVRSAAPAAATQAEIDERLRAAGRVFDEVDLFVAPSPSMAAEIERLGIAAAKIRTSDYGSAPLDRGPGGGGRPALRPLRIGYVGTLVWHKGVHVLLEAVRGLATDDYEVAIFGSPDTFADYAAGLRAQAAGLAVRFMGGFDRARAADVYSHIDVLAVPSLWLENSPLVIHEAFMAGVPVVGARIGGIPDLVEDGRTGLLYDPRSAASLSAALQRLIDSPALLAQLAEGVRTAPRVKTIAEDAREWERRYQEVSQPAARRGRPCAG